MGKKSGKNKKPKFASENRPREKREPKVAVEISGDSASPVWKFAHLDWDSPWCPSKSDAAGIRAVIARLSNFETMRWADIKSSGSHTVGTQGIIKEARDRLIERKLEEWADHLTSLRISAKERLWGFLRGDVFHVLWWDPKHEVYPSSKKNT